MQLVVSLFLLATTLVHGLPQDPGEPCPIPGLCPGPNPDPTQCGIPEITRIEFPGFDLAALTTRDKLVFDIINCKEDELLKVREWIPIVLSDATMASNDARFGIHSRFGFQALFKEGRSIPKVQQTFNKIATGAKPFQDGCWANYTAALVCVNDDPFITEDLHEECSTASRAFVTSDYPYAVFLCPTILEAPGYDDTQDLRCPNIAQNRLVPNTPELGESFGGIIMEELAHVYLGVLEIFPEAYNIQDAVDLNVTQSLENGASYAFYSTGMPSISIINFLDVL